MTRTIFHAPEAAVEVLIVIVVIAASVGLHALLQRSVKTDVLRRHNDVAGYLFSAVGVIYAVVLGFVVVVVWEKYDATVANVESEVAAVADLYHTSAGFPNPFRSALRSELRSYTDAMVRLEWPAMARNGYIRPNTRLLESMGYQIGTFSPETTGESNTQQIAMSEVDRLFDSRRERLIKEAPAVPMVLWFALVAGALSMLAFAYLFGVENRPAQLVMTAILAGLIAILFIVINEFDTPFSGSVSISNDGWIYLQQNLTQIP